jgi:cobyrinic acid a,c-diamide synthase
MSRLPRVAVGTLTTEADATALVWGLAAALEACGQHVQMFRARACFTALDGATVISGRAARHLDSWLMTPEAARQALLSGTAEGHLALVEGTFGPAGASAETAGAVGGQLDVLCDWLELPRLAVVDVTTLSGCHLPSRPAADGLLLDRISSEAGFYRSQTLLESLWGIPVLGGMEEAVSLRQVIAALAPGERPPRWLGEALGNALARMSDVDRIRRLAEARAFSFRRTPAESARRNWSALRVAIAWDDAFHCYYPETLEMLESRGATLCDFSPLGDERLPDGTDIVYFGCGHPERFAQALSENQCLAAGLRQHVCNGQRLYAEGGGLAYLCEQIELADGRRFAMSGVLPAIARENRQRRGPVPHAMELRHPNWLGAVGTHLRGYLNDRWTIEATGPLRVDDELAGQLNLMGRHQAIGSRVHLDFATDPAAVGRFFAPHAASLELSATRSE